MSWSILELLRSNPEVLKENLKKRYIDTSIVDTAVQLDKKWREVLREVERLRHQHNLLTAEIAKIKVKEEREKKIEEAKKILSILQEKEKELSKIEEERENLLLSLPNLVHDSVPVGPDDSYNVPIRFWGKFKVYKGDLNEFFKQVNSNVDYEILEWKPKGHAEMLEEVLGLGDTLKAGEVSGSRFYYLFEDLVWLDFALLLYAIDYMTNAGYTLILPPYMLRGEIIKSVIDLNTFKDAIYKIEDEDLYLIATAEHSIAAYLWKEDIDKEKLPLKFVGFSPAFRKEAGAANKDLKGIFRVHQFHKVEQFVFSAPEDSWKIFEELITNAENMFRGLGLPYRVVNIASGDLGACAAKKYDLEVWMPAQAKFREMVSCSNCTDWQAYRLKIRYVDRKNNKKGYVHTLNSTAIASTRVITAILENNQKEDGTVEIPKVLRKYLEPFQKAPKDYIYPRKKSSS